MKKNITSGLFLASVLFVCTITFCVELIGQQSRIGVPEIINFSKSDYQAGTQNWSITQDDQSILYIGNNKGVLEFDGVRWHLIQIPNRTIVRSVLKGEDGRIYVGAQDEFGYVSDSKPEQLTYHSLLEKIPVDDQSFEDVWKIIQHGEKIFFCSRRAIFVMENDQIDVFKPQGRFDNFFEASGTLFVQDIGFGLKRWEERGFAKVPGGELFTESRIAAILPHQEQLLLISAAQGMFFLDQERIQPWTPPSASFLKKNQAYCAIKLKAGGYAIGTVQNGLIIMDEDGNIQDHFNKESGLQNNTILSIHQDEAHSFWLGLDNGIDFVKYHSPFSEIYTLSGVEGTGYTSCSHNEILYLGTNQGVFYAPLSPSGSKARPLRFKKMEGLKGQVWGIDVIDHDVIISAHEGSFQVKNETAIPITNGYGAWKVIPWDGNPNMAIQGNYNGIRLIEKNTQTKQWQLILKLEGFHESARIMELDEDGSIWVSHPYKGVFRITLNKDFSIEELQFFDEEDGLPSDISIHVAKVKGEIIFGTPAGVYRFDKNTSRFIPYEQFNSILGGVRPILKIIEDRIGRIWFCAEKNFGVLKVEKNGFLKDVEVERLLFNQVQDKLVDGFEHVYAHSQNDVFIATEGGFLHYDPNTKIEEEEPLKILLRKVTSISKRDTVLFQGPQRQPEADPLSIPFSMNSLRFTFSSPFFKHVGYMQYRYRLEGFETTWSEWTDRTEKEYTNLKQGAYKFIIEARNANGRVSEPVVFELYVAPPWYASLPAQIIYGILGLLAIILFFRYYSKRLDKEKEAIVQEQTQKFAKKEAAFEEEKQKSESEIMRLRNENLEAQNKHQTAQLASATMHLVQKGEILLKIKRELKRVLENDASENKRKLQELIHTIDDGIRLDDNWEQFEAYFDQVHGNFLQNLREAYPQLTPKDQKLCAYLRMNLSTKEIAPLMNISVRGVEISRYRLRKKLGIPTETNLVDFILKF